MEYTLSYGEERNRVLRNTYLMLAITMVPTALAAWFGKALGLTALIAGAPILSFIVFLGAAIALMLLVFMFKDSWLGVWFLLMFTGVIGLTLSPTIEHYMGREGGNQLIALAAGGTGLIFLVMSMVATTMKRDISGWGKFLFIAVLGLIVAMVANIFLQLSFLSIVISAVAVVVFSAFLLYDLKQIVDGGETNYVIATMAVYLDLLNIFQHLLHLLGALSGDD